MSCPTELPAETQDFCVALKAHKNYYFEAYWEEIFDERRQSNSGN